jgi:hypothetical protein
LLVVVGVEQNEMVEALVAVEQVVIVNLVLSHWLLEQPTQ